MHEIQFIDQLSISQLISLFTNYYENSDLMKNPIKELTVLEMRIALLQYVKFIKKDDDKLRISILLPFITKSYHQDFINVIKGDPYFFEPLWHIANQNTENYDLFFLNNRFDDDDTD